MNSCVTVKCTESVKACPGLGAYCQSNNIFQPDVIHTFGFVAMPCTHTPMCTCNHVQQIDSTNSFWHGVCLPIFLHRLWSFQKETGFNFFERLTAFKRQGHDFSWTWFIITFINQFLGNQNKSKNISLSVPFLCLTLVIQNIPSWLH